ncbi:RNA-binding protein [Hyphomonas atlantica]
MTRPHRKSEARVTDTEGRVADGAGPVRQCTVSRDHLSQEEMVRFVLSPDQVVTPDILGKLPGRGVWLRADRDTLEIAMRKGAFARGFKQQATVPTDLPELVENLLLQRVISLMGMARKAGDIVLGFDQVREALQKKRPGLLLEATDGAEDGRSKVYFLAKALYSNVKIAGALSSEELGMAFGRERVIHGLVRKGPFAKTIELAYQRLAGFRARPELDWFPDQDR